MKKKLLDRASKFRLADAVKGAKLAEGLRLGKRRTLSARESMSLAILSSFHDSMKSDDRSELIDDLDPALKKKARTIIKELGSPSTAATGGAKRQRAMVTLDQTFVRWRKQIEEREGPPIAAAAVAAVAGQPLPGPVAGGSGGPKRRIAKR